MPKNKKDMRLLIQRGKGWLEIAMSKLSTKSLQGTDFNAMLKITTSLISKW